MQKIRSIETGLKKEIGDLKNATAQCTKKVDSLEKEMKSMKTALEDVQKMVRAGGGRSTGNGASGLSRHSSPDVSKLSCELVKRWLHYCFERHTFLQVA